MHILRRLPIAVALALPLAGAAQPTLQPGVKAVAPKQGPVQAAQPQFRVDEVTQLKIQLAAHQQQITRQQQQIVEMRQQLERTSRALEELQRKYAGHTHIVQGSAVPIDQFEGEVRRNYRNTRVSVSQGLLQTGVPRNNN